MSIRSGSLKTTKFGDWRQTFLEVLAVRGNVQAAAHAAGITRQNAYVARGRSKTFELAWVDALEEYADSLEEALVTRARDGWDEPVYQNGKLVGYIRRFSDRLLVLALTSARPNKYRERVSVDATTNQMTTHRVEVQILQDVERLQEFFGAKIADVVGGQGAQGAGQGLGLGQGIGALDEETTADEGEGGGGNGELDLANLARIARGDGEQGNGEQGSGEGPGDGDDGAGVGEDNWPGTDGYSRGRWKAP